MNEMQIIRALSLVDDVYVAESACPPPQSLPRRRNIVLRLTACLAAALLALTLSLGTAMAVNTQFRQAVISFFFPRYAKHEVEQIDNGHLTGSFDMEDTLYTFLEQFNQENMADGLTAAKDNGFSYTLLSSDTDGVEVLVVCDSSSEQLLVTMERLPYQETSGLWQVVSYQVVAPWFMP